MATLQGQLRGAASRLRESGRAVDAQAVGAAVDLLDYYDCHRVSDLIALYSDEECGGGEEHGEEGGDAGNP